MRNGRQRFVVMIALALAAIFAPTVLAAPATAAAGSDGRPPLTKEQLEQLLAPIALYPDALLTQMLMASTYPLELRSLNLRRGTVPRRGRATDMTRVTSQSGHGGDLRRRLDLRVAQHGHRDEARRRAHRGSEPDVSEGVGDIEVRGFDFDDRLLVVVAGFHHPCDRLGGRGRLAAGLARCG